MLWESAWSATNGHAFSGVISRKKLQPTYEDKDFLPSLHLPNLDPADYQIPAANGGAPAKTNAKKAQAHTAKPRTAAHGNAT